MSMTPQRGPRPASSEISPAKKVAVEDTGSMLGLMAGSEVYVPSMEELHHYGKNVYRFAQQINEDVIRYFNYIPPDVQAHVKQMFWDYVRGQLHRNQPMGQQARHEMAQIGQMAHNTYEQSNRDAQLVRMDDVSMLERLGEYLTVGQENIGDST